MGDEKPLERGDSEWGRVKTQEKVGEETAGLGYRAKVWVQKKVQEVSLTFRTRGWAACGG